MRDAPCWTCKVRDHCHDSVISDNVPNPVRCRYLNGWLHPYQLCNPDEAVNGVSTAPNVRSDSLGDPLRTEEEAAAGVAFPVDIEDMVS